MYCYFTQNPIYPPNILLTIPLNYNLCKNNKKQMNLTINPKAKLDQIIPYKIRIMH